MRRRSGGAIGIGLWFTLAVAIGTACRKKIQATRASASATPSAVTESAPPPASVLLGAPSPRVVPPERAGLESALSKWNAATNAADGSGLEAVYAENLNLYGRIVTRAAAVKSKLAYVANHAGFSQTIESASWSDSIDRRIASFRKTSSSPGAPASSVDAYLVFRQYDDGWRIVDEGDVETARKMQARADTLRRTWKQRFWDCPHCKDDPDLADDPPEAFPPLGPDIVKSSEPIPPGAPDTVEYGRAIFPRFASAVDIPLFVKATAQSTNGDGRWFYFDAPPVDAGIDAGAAADAHLLECAIGGHFWYTIPASAKRDPGHVGDPPVKYTEVLERRKSELSYERYIYAPDRVMNYVLCTFSPQYEAYFLAIVRRMGRSLRAIAGGQLNRVERESEPYRAD